MRAKLTLLLMCLVFIQNFSQEDLMKSRVNYLRDTKWNFGLNFGAGWQDFDIQNYNWKPSAGLTLGRTFKEKPYKNWTWGLRGRYLYGNSVGIDLQKTNLGDIPTYRDIDIPNYDTIYLNNRFTSHDFGLELVLNWHKLREKTGILFSIYGGLDWNIYNSTTIAKDSLGNKLNFSSLPENPSQTEISDFYKKANEQLSKSNNGKSNSGIASNIGIELGYQFTQRFSISIEHRIGFLLNDLVDGYEKKGSELLKFTDNDKFHYTNLALRWNIFKGKENDNSNVIYPQNNGTPNCNKPYLRFEQPVTYETFNQANIDISVQVENITSKNDVKLFLNDQQIDFNYDSQKNRIYSKAKLIVGENKLKILASNSCGDTEMSRVVYYKIDAPQVCPKPNITLKSNQNVYNLSNINYNFIVDNVDKVSVMLNNQQVKYDINNNNNFLLNLILKPGNNELYIKASNKCGDTTVKQTIIYNQQQNCDKPIISFTSHNDNQNVSNENIRLLFSIKYFTGTPNVTVNNQNANVLKQNNGNYYIDTKLNKGQNYIQVNANNNCGSDYENITLYYNCNSPIITNIKPINNSNTSQNSINFSANVKNTVKNNIQINVNGVNQAFNYNSNNGNISANINLQNGNNSIVLNAYNDCGGVYETINVLKNINCNSKPQITLNNSIPSNVTSGFSVSANISEVTNSNDIIVKLNGIDQNFNFQNSYLNVYLNNFITGQNNLTIYANNQCGSEQKSFNFIFNKNTNCEKPVINVSNNNPNSSQPNYNFYATISNVDNQNNIQVKLNGNPVIFNFYNAKDLFSNINLINGLNNIEIIANNECGISTQSYQVFFDCSKPKINLLNNSSKSSTNLFAIVKAQILNIDNSNQIEFKLNGVNHNFNFDANSHILSQNVLLENGSNNILIKATNGCGSDEQNIVIEKYCPAPTVNIQSPSNNSSSSNVNSVFSAVVSNVNNPNEISVFVNGKPVQFSLNGNIVTSNINLNNGRNDIKIEVKNSCGNASDQVTVNYNKPCPAPTVNIQSPSNNSSSSNVNSVFSAVVSNVNNPNEITLFVNGKPVQFSLNGNIVTSNINLNNGRNDIKIEVKNSCGNASDQVTVNYNKPCPAPTVNIQSPSNNSSSSNVNSVFSAVVSNVNNPNEITLFVNGKPVQFSLNGNIVTSNINLNNGRNDIKIEVRNSCGNASDQVTVNYNKPCPAPTVNIQSPSNNSSSSNVNSVFSAVVSNVNNPNEITVFVNGKPVQFSLNGNIVTSNINLNNGRNDLKIEVKNSCGNASDQVTVNYNKPCPAPTVNIQSPSNNSNSSNVNSVFSAIVSNVNNPNEITLFVNGKPVQFNLNGNIVTSNINLNNGRNDIKIEVKNSCGNASDQVTVNYNKPCPAPTVNIQSPSNNSSSSNVNSVFSAVVSNVNNSNEITLFVNGKPVQFSLNGNIVTSNINLNNGRNDIKIEVKNSCGNASDQVTVNYNKPCPAPTVNIQSPSNNSNSSNVNSVFSAVVSNVNNPNEITVFVNGKPVQFSLNGNIVTSNINLNNGRNDIKIEVKNSCGNASDQVTVNYNKPCPAPTVNIQSPSNNSSSSNVNSVFSAVVSNVNNPNEISVFVNGKPVQFSLNGNIVTSNINLNNGRNDIKIEVKNSCGNASDQVTVNYNKPCPAPTVNIQSPSNNSNSSNVNSVFSAVVSNVNNPNEITVFVNGKPVQFSLNGNIVTSNINLNNGRNDIKIEVKNSCGNASDQVTVNYNKPCPAPTVNIQSPSNNSSSSNVNSVFSAVVSNVNNPNEITLFVNGKPVQFSLNGNIVTSNINLNNGRNDIKIEVKNSCGNASDQVTVNYNKPCPAPTVNIQSPSNNSSSSNVNSVFSAVVSNVNNSNEITLFVNGKPVQFSLNGNIVTSNINLNNGRNDIKIEVKNSCGNASDQVTVNYNKPCPAPTVNIQSPSNNSSSSNVNSVFSAVVSNVNNSNEITVFVNGKPVQFSLNGNIVTSNINLNNGRNDIKIEVKNSCGNASDQVTVNYNKPCPAPQITLINPLGDSIYSMPRLLFKAKVLNVNNMNEIKLKNNGKDILFMFNNDTVSTYISLNEELNNIEISAHTTCGNKQHKIQIIYNKIGNIIINNGEKVEEINDRINSKPKENNIKR